MNEEENLQSRELVICQNEVHKSPEKNSLQNNIIFIFFMSTRRFVYLKRYHVCICVCGCVCMERVCVYIKMYNECQDGKSALFSSRERKKNLFLMKF